MTLAIPNWDSLNFSERYELNQQFLNEFTPSDNYGTVRVKQNGRTYGAFVDSPVDWGDYTKFWDSCEAGILPDELNLGCPEFKKSAKPLDFIVHFSLAHGVLGWFMSKKAKEVFEKFNLGFHRFYSFTAIKDGKPLDYFLLAIKTSDDHFINFQKSSFFIGGDDFEFQNIPTECSSLAAYEQWMDNREEDTLSYIGVRNIIVNKEFDKSKDIIRFTLLENNLLLSKRLLSDIIEKKLTGIEIFPESPVHFE